MKLATVLHRLLCMGDFETAQQLLKRCSVPIKVNYPDMMRKTTQRNRSFYLPLQLIYKGTNITFRVYPTFENKVEFQVLVKSNERLFSEVSMRTEIELLKEVEDFDDLFELTTVDELQVEIPTIPIDYSFEDE